MIAQTRAELLKIRSTRTTIGIVLGMIALILLFSLLSGLLTKAPDLSSAEDQRGQLSVGSLSGVFSALAGIMLITSEYRHGTIRPTFLFTPRRSRVLVAKLAAGLSRRARLRPRRRGARVRDRLPVSLGAWHSVRARRRRSPRCSCSARSPRVALWGAIGVGLGAIVRSQVGGIIGLLVWGFVIENLLFAFVPSVGRFAPVHAGRRARRVDRRPSPLGPRQRCRPRRLDRRARAAGAALAARRDVN